MAIENDILACWMLLTTSAYLIFNNNFVKSAPNLQLLGICGIIAYSLLYLIIRFTFDILIWQNI